jgi:hypothetical protein
MDGRMVLNDRRLTYFHEAQHANYAVRLVAIAHGFER